MAFSTQKEFFHMPFFNERLASECPDGPANLKSYPSTNDDRSWAADEDKKSRFVADLVACKSPLIWRYDDPKGAAGAGGRGGRGPKNGDKAGPSRGGPGQDQGRGRGLNRAQDGDRSGYGGPNQDGRGPARTVRSNNQGSYGGPGGRPGQDRDGSGKASPQRSGGPCGPGGSGGGGRQSVGPDGTPMIGDSLIITANNAIDDMKRIMIDNKLLDRDPCDQMPPRNRCNSGDMQRLLAERNDPGKSQALKDKIRELANAKKIEPTDECAIQRSIDAMVLSYNILDAENANLKRIVEKQAIRAPMESIKIDPEKSKDVDYLQKKIDNLGKELAVLRQSEDSGMKYGGGSSGCPCKSDADGSDKAEMDIEVIKKIMDERQALRCTIQSLGSIENKVKDMRKRADRASSDLENNFNAQNQMICNMECEMQEMQRYYETEVEQSKYTEEILKCRCNELQQQVVSIQPALQRCECMQMEIDVLRNELRKRDLAMNAYDCQYQQLMTVICELNQKYGNKREDCPQPPSFDLPDCPDVGDDLAFYTGATLEHIMNEMGKQADCFKKINQDQDQYDGGAGNINNLGDCMQELNRLRTLLRQKDGQMGDLIEENECLCEGALESKKRLNQLDQKVRQLDEDTKYMEEGMRESIGLIRDIGDIARENDRLKDKVNNLKGAELQALTDDMKKQLEDCLKGKELCDEINKNFKNAILELGGDPNAIEKKAKEAMQEKWRAADGGGLAGVGQAGGGPGQAGAGQPGGGPGGVGAGQPGGGPGGAGVGQPGGVPGEAGAGQPGGVLGEAGAGQPGGGPGEAGAGQPGGGPGGAGAGQPGGGPGEAGAGQPGGGPGGAGAGQPGGGPGGAGAGQPGGGPGGAGAGQPGIKSEDGGPGQAGGKPGEAGAGQPGGKPGEAGAGQSEGKPGEAGAGQPGGKPGEAGVGEPGGKPGEAGAGQPGAKPGEAGADQPGAKPGEAGAGKPGDSGAGQPGAKPGEAGAGETGAKPGEAGAGKPGDTGAGQPGGKPGDAGAGQPGGKPGETGAGQPGAKPGETGAGQPGGKPGEAGAGQAGAKPGDAGAGQPGAKPGEAGAGKADGKPGEAGAGKADGKPGEAGAGKPGGTPGEAGAGQPGGKPGDTGAGQPGGKAGEAGAGKPGGKSGEAGAGKPGEAGAGQPGAKPGDAGAAKAGGKAGDAAAGGPAAGAAAGGPASGAAAGGPAAGAAAGDPAAGAAAGGPAAGEPGAGGPGAGDAAVGDLIAGTAGKLGDGAGGMATKSGVGAVGTAGKSGAAGPRRKSDVGPVSTAPAGSAPGGRTAGGPKGLAQKPGTGKGAFDAVGGAGAARGRPSQRGKGKKDHKLDDTTEEQFEDFVKNTVKTLSAGEIDGMGLERELRKILDMFIDECGFCFCKCNIPKSRFYAICHKLYHHGLHTLDFRDLAYMHKRIFAAAENILPGCLFNMIMKDILATNPQSFAPMAIQGPSPTPLPEKQCCTCKNSLCCDDTEEKLMIKVTRLENDIENAKMCLKNLKNIPSNLSIHDYRIEGGDCPAKARVLRSPRGANSVTIYKEIKQARRAKKGVAFNN